MQLASGVSNACDKCDKCPCPPYAIIFSTPMRPERCTRCTGCSGSPTRVDFARARPARPSLILHLVFTSLPRTTTCRVDRRPSGATCPRQAPTGAPRRVCAAAALVLSSLERSASGAIVDRAASVLYCTYDATSDTARLGPPAGQVGFTERASCVVRSASKHIRSRDGPYASAAPAHCRRAPLLSTS